MSEKAAKTNAVAILAGAAVGYSVYRSKSAKPLPADVCSQLPAGAQQSLAQAIQGAKSNALYEFALGTLGAYDLVTKLASFGLIQPDAAAAFYAWYNNLSPEQTAAVKFTEDGSLLCAAAETGQQIETGGDALLAGAVAGLLAYVGAQLVLGDS